MPTATGIVWFVFAVPAFTAFMYALSEILANRFPTREEYVGSTPPLVEYEPTGMSDRPDAI